MQIIKQLEQFVPSSVCLKCDGCCRFKSVDSPWRPKVGQAENLALKAPETDVLDDQGYIKAIGDCGNHLCRFFNKADSTCRVYDQRPFECALYPFILSRSPEGVQAHVHLACPYVQDHHHTKAFEDYAAYLKGFFHRPETRDFLRRNSNFIHDYSIFQPELQYLFTIQGLCL